MSVTSDAAYGAALSVRGAVAPGGQRASARLGHIEVIRGLACLMVVAYHVIGNDPLHGMRMPEGGTWWAIPRLLDAVQMPLFAFVSGWVFSIADDDAATFRAALAKKLLRLALPLVSVTLVYLTLASVTGRGSGTGVIAALILPYQHLWYLQASLWLVAFAGLGAWVMKGHSLAFAGLGLALALAAFLPVPRFSIDLLSIEQAIYLAPFFFVGRLARVGGIETAARTSDRRFVGTLAALAAATLGGAIATSIAFHAAERGDTPMQTAPALIFASALALLLILMRPRSKALEAIGARSFTIYLFHVLFAASARELVVWLWPGVPSLLLFFLLFAIGVGAPFMLHGLITRHRWSALAFLGSADAGGRR